MAVDHYENFPVASILLPRALRAAVRDIYRYARSADDIADEGHDDAPTRLRQLAAYRAELHRIARHPESTAPHILYENPELAPIFVPLARTIARHQLPIAPFDALLSAFEQDVITHRYDDYDTLLDYCTRSANPVGQLMLHLYQRADADNLVQADAICTGLQLTNFWQDIQRDWDKGRVYLPRADLARYGLDEDVIATQGLSTAWTDLMRFQTDRARALLHFGAPLARQLPGRIGLELKLVVQGGLRILERIDACRGDVFLHRPSLGRRDGLIMLWRALTNPK